MIRRTTIVSLAWACAALSAMCQPAWALGVEAPYSAHATAPNVDWVQVCGAWPAPRDESPGGGTYRVVHASQYAQSFIYVQWLQRDRSDSAIEVATVSVPEINNDHAEWQLSRLRCQATAQGIRITAQAESGHEDGTFDVTLEAGHRPGDLRYRRTPARRTTVSPPPSRPGGSQRLTAPKTP